MYQSGGRPEAGAGDNYWSPVSLWRHFLPFKLTRHSAGQLNSSERRYHGISALHLYPFYYPRIRDNEQALMVINLFNYFALRQSSL